MVSKYLTLPIESCEIRMSFSTALYSSHKNLKAKIVPFAGWMMPVSYEGVLAEHKVVRQGCGIFDVSHMGELFIEGPGALDYLQFMTINDVAKLGVGMGQYTAILNDQGGMIDDLILYRTDDTKYLICMNASNILKDSTWFFEHIKKFDVQVKNESDSWSQIAVQGPKSEKVMTQIFGEKILKMDYMSIIQERFQDSSVWIARTGYTGESGFEIYLPNLLAAAFWEKLLSSSEPVKPCGLGARDTLRLEACYLLYGNDMNDTVSPLEAGIGWATKLHKLDFIGKTALVTQKEQGIKRQIFTFKMLDEGIPRHGMKVYAGEKELGEVTSGSVLPTLGGAGGMALLQRLPKLSEGSVVEIDIRGERKKAIICKRPLYLAKTKNL